MAQQFIAVLYPLCVVCYYFLKYQPQQHPPGRQYSQKSLISAGFIPNLVLADVGHFSGRHRPASPWSGTARGWMLGELAAGGRRKSQGCNPEQ